MPLVARAAGLDLQHLTYALARPSRLPNAALKLNNSKGSKGGTFKVIGAAKCFSGERRWCSVLRGPDRPHLPAPGSSLDVVRASCSGTADTTVASAVAVSTAGSATAVAVGCAAAATLADGPAAAALADSPVLPCSSACKVAKAQCELDLVVDGCVRQEKRSALGQSSSIRNCEICNFCGNSARQPQ